MWKEIIWAIGKIEKSHGITDETIREPVANICNEAGNLKTDDIHRAQFI